MPELIFSNFNLGDAAKILRENMDDGDEWTHEEAVAAIDRWLAAHVKDVLLDIDWWAFGPRSVGNMYRDLYEVRGTLGSGDVQPE